MPAESPGPLSNIRVLDLANSRAELAGRLLADLGAEVLKAEPPGGVDSRRRGPFDTRPEGADESLYWAAVGVGKRSVVLDLESVEDRNTAAELAARADVLVESFDPGRMRGWGLDYGTLSAANPGLVYVSVSPFGQGAEGVVAGDRPHYRSCSRTRIAPGRPRSPADPGRLPRGCVPSRRPSRPPMRSSP